MLPYDTEHAAIRFQRYINKTETCWLWMGARSGSGHGSFSVRALSGWSSRQAHRVAWELQQGAIPKGMCILHLCNVPACVRVEHLTCGTWQENVAHRDAFGNNGRARKAAGLPPVDHPRPKRRLSLQDRYALRVQRGPDCWLWIGALDRKGYGVFTIGRRTIKAHRAAYEFTHGPIPPRLCVLHRCDTPPCVRYDHLFLGTRADNEADKVTKGRQARGERQHLARLTTAAVVQMRALRKQGTPWQALADTFGVWPQTARMAVIGRTWKHVEV